MNSHFDAVIGVLGGLINTSALFPYVKDILAGNTKPERATWWVWLVLSSTSCIAQIVSGAKWSLVYSISSLIGITTIAVLSLKYGYGHFHRRDTLALVATGIGVVISYLLKDPLLAVLTVIAVDFAGGGLTLYKTWFAPHTENLLAWNMSIVGGILAFVAVGNYKPAIYLPSLSVVIYNLLLVSIIIYRRDKVGAEPADI
ncbi:MAG: hypothetical protein ACXWLH_05040 [Candidatus Saccharimonadales bacterium]